MVEDNIRLSTQMSYVPSHSFVMYLLLYLSPLLPRFGMALAYEPVRICMSLFPLCVALPSTILPKLMRDEEREHIARHILYATAFTLSVAMCIRWDVVRQSMDEKWAVHLIVYLSMGTLSLWWFALSHLLENRWFLFLHTHHGDVAVLPLTLVAIGTFIEEVPNNAFQFSRSTVFYIPIVVGWTTLHFIAFNGFATKKTTTHSSNGFHFLAFTAQIIASTHLALIEMKGTPFSFLIFSFVAACLCQLTPPPTSPPRLRKNIAVGMLILNLLLSLPFALLMRHVIGHNSVIIPGLVISSMVVLTIPTAVGNRWVFPAGLYSTLLMSSYVGGEISNVSLLDILAIMCVWWVVFGIIDVLSSPEEDQCLHPAPPPPTAPNASTAQMKYTLLSSMYRMFDSVTIPSSLAHGEHLVDGMLSHIHSSCPIEFTGVWWMEGNHFPVQLLTVHSHTWNKDIDGTYTTSFNLADFTTRSASLSGILNRVGQGFCTMQVEWARGERWVRTPSYMFSFLRLFPATLWLYISGVDEMERLMYDSRGVVTLHYRMLRVARADGSKTRHYQSFLKKHSGVCCIANLH